MLSEQPKNREQEANPKQERKEVAPYTPPKKLEYGDGNGEKEEILNARSTGKDFKMGEIDGIISDLDVDNKLLVVNSGDTEYQINLKEIDANQMVVWRSQGATVTVYNHGNYADTNPPVKEIDTSTLPSIQKVTPEEKIGVRDAKNTYLG